MFFRKISTKKNGKEYVYLKLIESYRAEGKVRQRVLANFGSMAEMTQGKIQSLIVGLSKLHQEFENKQEQESSLNKHQEVEEYQQRLSNSSIHHTLGKIISNPKEYEMAQALLIKTLVGGGGGLSIQEYAQQYKLSEATNIQYYHLMKKLGSEDIRKSLYEQWLLKKCCERSQRKIIYIHLVPVTFNGTACEGPLTEGIFLPGCYKKKLILLLACDGRGIPYEFDYTEGYKHLKHQVDALAHRLSHNGQVEIVVLDGENRLNTDSTHYRLARIKTGDLEEVTPSFKLIHYQPSDQTVLKATQARMARAAARLEMLKADILLGKITRESSIRKKAEGILKDFDCENLIHCHWNWQELTFYYETNQLAWDRLNHARETTEWYLPDRSEKWPSQVEINPSSFLTIYDQLQVPLINTCSEYHYSPEVISAHILLELLRFQLEQELKKSLLEVPSEEYLQCCI